MKKKYTQEDIDQFFGNFKELPDYFDLEKVHQLIDNPAAKATQPGNHFKPFKFLIMTSAIIAVVASFMLWPKEPVQEQGKDVAQSPPVSITEKAESGQEDTPALPKSEENELPLKSKEPGQTISPANLTGLAERKGKTSPKNKAVPQNKKPITANFPLSTDPTPPWPSDTVIDGNQFLITLNDEELEKLGFMLDNNGIYFKNIFNGDTSSFYSYRKDGMGSMSITLAGYHDSRNKKSTPSQQDFYPTSISDVFYLLQKKNERFKLEDDILAPVILQSHQYKSLNDEGMIVWFRTSDNFFDALPKRYQHLRTSFKNVKELKKMHPKHDVVKYELKTILDNMSFIELSEKELIPLGFKINSEGIFYQINLKNAKVNLSLEKGGVAGVSVNNQIKNPEPDKIILSFLSDRYGMQRLKWSTGNDDKDRMKTNHLLDKAQLLVPIIISQSSFPEILQEDQVIWFEPSEELFDALPKTIGNQLRQEYNYLTAPNEEARKYLSTSCTFFEACKSTLQLNNLKLMPNPASYTTTISFEGLEEAPGTISLVNLSGNLVKVLVANETFRKGTNTFQFDLSGIGAGIYLISINTDKGFKTQRLVITR